jgi:hypothetical protein
VDLDFSVIMGVIDCKPVLESALRAAADPATTTLQLEPQVVPE